MLKEYFKLIRQALSENRQKKGEVYYEAHHIVPRSFGKKSSVVLLTPEEHYRVHKILAEEFKAHHKYSQKVYWAFHRLAYDGKRQISEEEYASARKLLMPMWKRKKPDTWKSEMSQKMLGNKNALGGKKDWKPTEEQIKNYSLAAVKRQTGRIGEKSQASKGTVVCEDIITGEIVEAGSALQLANKLNLENYNVLHNILNREAILTPRSKYYEKLKNKKIYYK
jgi:hypothetical protein